jgi:hypothetical protein
LSIGPKPLEDGTALLAVGLESGRLELWSIPTFESSNRQPSLMISAPLSLCHKATGT